MDTSNIKNLIFKYRTAFDSRIPWMKNLSAQFLASRGDGRCLDPIGPPVAVALPENGTETRSKRSSARASGSAPPTRAAGPILDPSHDSPGPSGAEQRSTSRIFPSAGPSPASSSNTSFSGTLLKRTAEQPDSDVFAKNNTTPFESYGSCRPTGMHDDVVYCVSATRTRQAKRRRKDVEHDYDGRVSTRLMAPFSKPPMKPPYASVSSSSEPKRRLRDSAQGRQRTARVERVDRGQSTVPSDPRVPSPLYSDEQTFDPIGDEPVPAETLSPDSDRGADAVTEDTADMMYSGAGEGDDSVEEPDPRPTTDELSTVEPSDEQLPTVRGSSPVSSGSRIVRFPRSRLRAEQLKPKRQANIGVFFDLLVDGCVALVDSDGDSSCPGFFVVTESKIRVVSVRRTDDTVDEVSLTATSRN